MIPNTRSATPLPLVDRMILPASIVYTDAFNSYAARNVSGCHHVRINHSGQFVDRQNHINGIENFWNQAKRHLRRANGIPRASFFLFLKACQWRLNGDADENCLTSPTNRLKVWRQPGWQDSPQIFMQPDAM